jgi:hypothetical protein
MVTVTRNEVAAGLVAEALSAPTDSAARAPAEEGIETIPDSKGRRLTLRDPDILSESRLVRSLGEAASNTAYMYAYVLPAASVIAIDGQPMPFPMGEREVDAAIQRIGRHGLHAIMLHAEKQAKAAQEKLRALGEGNELKK